MPDLKQSLQLVILMIGCLLISPVIADYQQGLQTQRDKALKLMQNGDYKDSYEIYKKLALDPKNSRGFVIHDDIRYAVQNLNRLGQAQKADRFLENVVKRQKRNWYGLRSVANVYLTLNNNGTIISGQFRRGYFRGRGRYVNSALRDRVRSLQLYQQALQLAESRAKPFELAGLYTDYAGAMIRHANPAGWRLTLRTDLNSLPDYQDNNVYYAEQQRVGSPAKADGSPLYFSLPKSFSTAKNDGERWQWLMQQAAQTSEGSVDSVNYTRANVYHDLYGVKTLVRSPQPYARHTQDNALQKDSGYSVRTLKEHETIAKLATGIKRFSLPNEFNYILIWQSLAENSQSHQQHNALYMLARLFENRQQYPKAADYWRQVLKLSPKDKHAKQKINTITGNWGRFETTRAAVADKPSELWFRFRNANKVEISLHRINVKRLLGDVKNYIKSNPQKMNHRKMDVNNIGYRLVEENDSRYLQDEVDSWSLDLDAYRDHFDKRSKITIPKQSAGAYLVKAKLVNGNTSRIVLWLNDTVLLRKQLGDKTFYYVADAATGKPIEGARLDFFGYKRDYIKIPKPLNNLFYKTKIKLASQVSDDNGSVMVNHKQKDSDYQWLVTATNDKGRFAYLGFERIWTRHYDSPTYVEKKVLVISDRPVYRPGHTVKYKLWARMPSYGEEFTSKYADRTELLRIFNPKGEKIFEEPVKLDKFGGYQAELKLDPKATLGVYRVDLSSFYQRGHNTFRVEEYKKPEFEVKLEASEQAVALGENVPVKLKANYYYGQPVSKATVTYKVYRYEHSSRWYPAMRWDWLYGNGYWWSAYDYPWYAGWKRWGCFAPIPHWYNQPTPAPELVAEQTQPIPENGELTIQIDTAMAKQLYGDKDHRYEIQAEVTDASRRTITGSTSVVVSHKPFKVYAWVDKGYYQVGDRIEASFKAQTATRNAVQGKGKVTLYKINYDEKGTPSEQKLKSWQVKTNDRGELKKSFVVDNAGQYRVALNIKDKHGKSDTGGYLFNVIGDKKAVTSMRFNPLEIISQKREYSTNEKASLLINTEQSNSTVLLFERPVNGIYQKPRLLNLKGKSTRHTITLSKKDMPNIFVEAVTVRDGKVYTELRELKIPPEKRTLNVALKANKKRYQPGEKATLKVKVTDDKGEPVIGDTVISVYDAAVEYISGGSNVPDLREYFWKWRRHHSTNQRSNVQYYYPSRVRRGELTLQPIGVLGNLLGTSGRRQNNSGLLTGLASANAPEPELAMADGIAQSAPVARMKGEMKLAKAKRKPSSSDKRDSIATPDSFQQATVRKQFADTAFWSARVKLDKGGNGSVQFTMPENLTNWKARAWSLAQGTRVGQTQTEVVTYKNVILRMQAPRFFVEKDEVVLSANIHIYTDKTQTVKAIIELPGQQLTLQGKTTRQFKIKPQAEQRVDWRVKVKQEGEAVIRMKALTRSESDAVEMRFPVYVHGMAKTESFTGSISDQQSTASININIPQARRIDSAKLEIQYSPTLAGAMIDALPYLVEYPYGCTEQTLSRFLPTVITQNVLNKMGVNLTEIKNKQINLNPQELGNAKERARQWQRYKRNPVFDAAEVTRMSKHGIERLAAMQLSDGGWGWFSGTGETSSPHTTAYVVHGLQLAKQNDLAVPGDSLQRGIDWLKHYLDKRHAHIKAGEKRQPKQTRQANNIDAFVYMLLIEGGLKTHRMQDYLYRDKKQLSVYAKAMLALAFHKQGDKKRLAQLQRNIEQYLVEDKENQTAYLDLPNKSYWWFWYGSDIEANAYYLKLLARTQPKSQKAAWLVKYLINNRKHASYWNSTRDTAVAIEALAEYILASGETDPDMEIIVRIDGKEHKRVKINKQNLFSFDSRLVLSGKQLQGGKHTISLERVGQGPVYFNAYLHYFSLEDYIKKAGLEIKVERQYYKLVREDKRAATPGALGHAVEYQTEKYQRVPITDLATLKSGELVEVELSIQSKNDYEYLIFEDMKPAGFEPVEVRSGYNGNDLGAFVEFRDERVSFFVTRLARGKHSVSYRMRAEIPGKFSALPTRASAMYAPELKANADEIKLKVTD